MTVQPPIVNPASDSSEQTLVANVLQALLVLLGAMGVAVSPIFENGQVLQTIAGALCVLGGTVWTMYSHYKKSDQLQTAKAQLAQTRAALGVATARSIPRA